ncbi:MAG: D-galactarate dehydratase [Rhodobacteraceae bacterium]|nr:D-galactarate dehydratase [Paracoccaceae bacterium]
MKIAARPARVPAQVLILAVLSACGPISLPFARQADAPREPAPQVQTATADTARPMSRPETAITAAATTTPAAQPVAAPGALGTTLAGLGSPTEGGLWLRTGLVTRVAQGRVVVPSGQSVQLELRPSGQAPGSGSQMSLAAYQALGVPLTQLVRLQVFAN